MIRKANIKDIDVIYQISKDTMLNMKGKRQSKNISLETDSSKEYYEKQLNKDSLFYVSEIDGNVIAFLLAFNREDIDELTTMIKTIDKLSEKPYIFIKQFYIDKKYIRKGYGTELYEYFLLNNKKDIFSSIASEPKNKALINFYCEIGFNCVLTQTQEENRRKAIYYRKYENNYCNDHNFIFKNYDNAMEMYRHEDNLNWTKINHLLVINTALIGFLGLVIANIGKITTENLIIAFIIILFSIFGITANILFYIAIKSGILYLQNRKEQTATIERIIKNMGGVEIVGSKQRDDKRFIRSNTITVMSIIPIVLIIIWVLLMSFILCKDFLTMFTLGIESFT